MDPADTTADPPGTTTWHNRQLFVDTQMFPPLDFGKLGATPLTLDLETCTRCRTLLLSDADPAQLRLTLEAICASELKGNLKAIAHSGLGKALLRLSTGEARPDVRFCARLLVAKLRPLCAPTTPSRRARSEAVRARFARAVRRQIAVNRLAGVGSPGAGSLLEEARKKGEQRHTAAVMAARNLCDTDSEALILAFARVEEERHEAVAALALEVVVNRAEQGRQANQIEKLKDEKEEAERHRDRERQLRVAMQDDVGRLRARLRWEQQRMERVEGFERRQAERFAQVERTVMGRELLQLEETVDDLRREVRTLRSLTETMISGRKRAQEDMAACEAATAAARARARER